MAYFRNLVFRLPLSIQLPPFIPSLPDANLQEQTELTVASQSEEGMLVFLCLVPTEHPEGHEPNLGSRLPVRQTEV